MQVSKYSDNLWAEEMGIDISDLLRESPSHIEQIRNHRRINKQAAEYWARERFLARVEADTRDTVKAVDELVVKKSGKRAKVRRYEFTDAQLEIAFRSLNAEGSV
jgi:hypothetical protein